MWNLIYQGFRLEKSKFEIKISKSIYLRYLPMESGISYQGFSLQKIKMQNQNSKSIAKSRFKMLI